jgi:DNA repair exonuclease SbcCD nuclease subunit
MKFLHAADIHLDSPLAGLARRGAIPAHVTQDCTRRAFVNVIDLAIAEDVAFVLIAGDLYDGDWRDFSTGLFFNEQMRRLGRPCIIVRGNHDAASVITSKLTQPANVFVMSTRKVDRWASDELGVVIHGRSFPDRHIPEDFSDTYPGPEFGKLSIAMLHTSADDPGAHEVYAPCRAAALAGMGYDYWALGHIHERRVLHANPFVIFPGNIQGRHARETGAKGVTLVDVSEGRIVDVAHRATDVLRWAQIEVPLEGAESMPDAAMRLRFAFEEHTAVTEGRPVIARVVLQGATDLHAGFAADPAAIEAECRNAADAAQAEIYVERVVLQTRMTGPAGRGANDVLAEAFAGGLADSELVERVLADFKKLRQDLPFLPGGERSGAVPESPESLRALLDDAWHLAEKFLRGGETA